ncbi:WWE domain-containing protein [Durusdinium trenchii]|uniref:WWE domain-containing protein n=1 Tax=Durusdinium trenchii TaxID=1381693 RepID=A0ABP0JPB3_9DINO
MHAFWYASVAAWEVACGAFLSPFGVPASSEIRRWERFCDRLTQLQRRIKFAPLESFTVGDRTFPLPLETTGPSSGCPCQEEIPYLNGFFDGDGCVSMEKSHGVIHMKICQSLDSAAVLMRFRDFLGGGIYRHSDRTGTKEATLQWKVHGTTMQHAADVLCKFPSMQRAQLQIAAGGAVARADRSDMIQTLKQLKQMDHVPTTFQSSWPYFAGFFDAEGSITVGGTYVGLHLQVHQKNPFVLEELHSFLLKHKLNKWALHSDNSRGAWKLQCRHRATCQLTLRHLLDSGLDLKKRQADLALSLTADNQMQVREAMFELNGNQNKYGRLDGPGIQRAKEISSVRQQLKKASQQERELLEVKLEGLLEEHKLQNLVTKSLRLRGSIRQSLQEGGFIV